MAPYAASRPFLTCARADTRPAPHKNVARATWSRASLRCRRYAHMERFSISDPREHPSMLTLIGKAIVAIGVAIAGGKNYKGKINPVDHIHWKKK